MRYLMLATALSLALGLSTAQAQSQGLPDIGSSAGELLTPARQAEYGAMFKRELRNYGYLLDDPLMDQWLDNVGRPLGAASAMPRQKYTFFMLRDRQINAFATLGGYVGMNAGLVLMAEREDEVAAVLAHEVAHVTQQHVLRGVERAQRDQIPILLGMLAAVIAAQQAGGSSAGEATMASITSAMGLMQQRQINYTRSNESEADRLGIRTLARSGYDVDAMAGTFQRMEAATRSNTGGYQTPEFLRTHPVNVTRISEAKQRAEQIRQEHALDLRAGSNAPSLPAADGTLPELERGSLLPRLEGLSLDLAAIDRPAPGSQFRWAQERLRVLSAPTTAAALNEYEALAKRQADGLDPAQRHGVALARLQAGGNARQVAQSLQALLAEHPDNLWLEIPLAQAWARAGEAEQADAIMQRAANRLPGNRAVALTHAQILNARGSVAAAQQAITLLRPLTSDGETTPELYRQLARAWEQAGDPVRAGEAHAEASWLGGRAEQALLQLQTLKHQQQLDYVSQARIDARIETLMPEVLELKRQGVHDRDLEPR
ncbi:peptidase [Stenotrophomonas ginsengisoli]|uniref:Putative beta-barrel assembly-enhancing protease n=1 Tax=Stenotrophomonas ginsengisoli TaxID=336566 RepID=A0A0R0CXU9_9GAMM|nr:peptidase [Stenotrophomonas ginsengisoli]